MCTMPPPQAPEAGLALAALPRRLQESRHRTQRGVPIEKLTLHLHLASGQSVPAIYEAAEDLSCEEVEQEVLELLQAADREYVNLGGVIVHTGALSAVEILG